MCSFVEHLTSAHLNLTALVVSILQVFYFHRFMQGKVSRNTQSLNMLTKIMV